MSRTALSALALASLVPLLAACAQVQPVATPLPPPAPVTVESRPSPAPTPTPVPTPTSVPSASPASPEPVPAAPVVATFTPPPPKPKPTPKPKPKDLPAKTTKPAASPSDAECRETVVKFGSKGACARRAQELLKHAGAFSPKPGNTFTASAVNWTLVYQRSRGIPDTGTVGPQTWAALLSGKPKLPQRIPASCRTAGVVICASKAQGKLYWLKDGAVKKTIPVRFGGWTTDKNGKWRLHATVNGSYRVYRKHPNPPSQRYGPGAMPYSTMFDPNMYVHYSAPFAREGLSGSSHGCINVKSRSDAKWVMDNTPIGAKVVVFSG